MRGPAIHKHSIGTACPTWYNLPGTTLWKTSSQGQGFARLSVCWLHVRMDACIAHVRIGRSCNPYGGCVVVIKPKCLDAQKDAPSQM